MMEMCVCCFEVTPYWNWTTQTAIWLIGPPTQSCWDKIDGRFLLFWAHSSAHDTGMSASTACAHTLCLHYLIHTTCLGFQNYFFFFTGGNNVDDPRGSILLTRFQFLLVISHVFKTAAYAMCCQRKAHPSLSHPHIQKLREHIPQSTPSGITGLFFSCCFAQSFKIHVSTSRHPL